MHLKYDILQVGVLTYNLEPNSLLLSPLETPTDSHNIPRTLDHNAGIVKEACSGLGTDDEQLIKILCCRTKTQLERIDQAYRTKYEKTLWEKVSMYTGRETRGELVFDVTISFLRCVDQTSTATVQS